jgi:hypothetical protein
MLFRLDLSNHGAPHNLEDFAELLRLLVEAAGHRFTRDADPAAAAIFIECFGPDQAAAVDELARAGPVVIVATEFVTGDTFNDFPAAGDLGHYGKRDYWRQRRDCFIVAARRARAVWCASDEPQQLERYRDLVPGVPVLPLPWPCFEGFPAVTHRPPGEKDITLLFTGHRTEYRCRILAGLAERHKVHSPKAFYHGADRRELLARAKLCLNVRQSPAWRSPSLMRYWWHLSNRSAVLGECCAAPCALDRYVRTVPAEQLADACQDLLTDDRWEREAAAAYERFAAECPGRPAAEQLLERTLG